MNDSVEKAVDNLEYTYNDTTKVAYTIIPLKSLNTYNCESTCEWIINLQSQLFWSSKYYFEETDDLI